MKVLLILLCFTIFGYSEDILLNNGTTLKSATVSKTDPMSATFIHDEGITRVIFDDLPDDQKKKLNLTREKAVEYSAIERKAALQRELEKKDKQEYERLLTYLDSKAIEVSAKVIQVLDNGEILATASTMAESFYTKKTQLKNAGNSLGSSVLSGPIRTDTKREIRTIEFGICHVQTGNKKLRPDDHFVGNVWLVGTYNYTDIRGGEREVPKVIYSESLAMRHLLENGSLSLLTPNLRDGERLVRMIIKEKQK